MSRRNATTHSDELWEPLVSTIAVTLFMVVSLTCLS